MRSTNHAKEPCACTESTPPARRPGLAVQRRAVADTVPAVPARLMSDAIGGGGRALDTDVRDRMGQRLQADFSRVRVHTDERAAALAERLSASALTVGRHVLFAAGHYAPRSPEGAGLLAHELTHVLQQPDASPGRSGRLPVDPDAGAEAQAAGSADAAAMAPPPAGGLAVQRKKTAKPKIGTKFTHPKGAKSPFKKISAKFDGADIAFDGDGKQILRTSAQSGHPNSVPAAEIKACKGSPGDSYLNNPRYVGSKDKGPIPEGRYSFRADRIATFDTTERLTLLGGGYFTDPFGGTIHGGDWGAGRVPLAPVRIDPSPFCGNTAARSGFYMHGGIMPGSSGCIDIGNSGFESLVKLMPGYTGSVTVDVKYTASAPSVGRIGRALGRFTYPSGIPQGQEPSLWDRLGSAFGGDDE